MKKEVDSILARVIHPETGLSVTESGMVESIALSDDWIEVSIYFKRPRDPFANSIKKQLVNSLTAAFPEMDGKISVGIKQATPRTVEIDGRQGTAQVDKIIAVASGKGGVGKSTVAANIAVSLASMGYRVGLLDADIYGPSQPGMFGLEGYAPAAEVLEGKEMIVPAEKYGVKIMSVGFFITPSDALIWRGPMATGALKQLIHQTLWGPLDYLLIDLPPGTGDVHLTILSELSLDGAVIVSTPQQVALADVKRGISMFRSEKIAVPVLGIIENMAWFTPKELPRNRYYIFGQGGAVALAREEGIDLLGEIPIVQSVMKNCEDGRPEALSDKGAGEYYRIAAKKIVNKLEKSVDNQ